MRLSLSRKVGELRKNKQLLPSTLTFLKQWTEVRGFPLWYFQSIDELIENRCWPELNDRFHCSLQFGTGGMRGRTIGKVQTKGEKSPFSDADPVHAAVGSNLLNDVNILRATLTIFNYCKTVQPFSRFHDTLKLIVAYDGRFFSQHFCKLIAATWQKLGGQAFIFDGPRSTPQLSFTIRYTQATIGIMITASHNPYYDNGIKIYLRDGAQVVAPHDEAITHIFENFDIQELSPHFDNDCNSIPTLTKDYDEVYRKNLENTILDKKVIRENKPRIVYTPLHGCGSLQMIPLLESFGVEVNVVEEQKNISPRFPTVESPNPEKESAFKLAFKLADQEEIPLVLATDPDSDRLGVGIRNVEGEMTVLTGNQLAAILLNHRIESLKKHKWLSSKNSRSAVILKSFVTTPLLDKIAEAHRIPLIPTLTGFKWFSRKLKLYEDKIKEQLYEEQGIGLDYDNTSQRKQAELAQQYSRHFIFGAEESYGYLVNDSVRDKDAHMAALLLCELQAQLQSENRSLVEYLDELYLKYGYFYETQVNLYYPGATGQLYISKLLHSYTKPFKKIGSFVLKKFSNFATDVQLDLDNDVIPNQNFYILEFEEGFKVAIRASGTEPKIKYYIFVQSEIQEGKDLSIIKKETIHIADQLKAEILKDIEKRCSRFDK